MIRLRPTPAAPPSPGAENRRLGIITLTPAVVCDERRILSCTMVLTGAWLARVRPGTAQGWTRKRGRNHRPLPAQSRWNRSNPASLTGCAGAVRLHGGPGTARRTSIPEENSR